MKEKQEDWTGRLAQLLTDYDYERAGMYDIEAFIRDIIAEERKINADVLANIIKEERRKAVTEFDNSVKAFFFAERMTLTAGEYLEVSKKALSAMGVKEDGK